MLIRQRNRPWQRSGVRRRLPWALNSRVRLPIDDTRWLPQTISDEWWAMG